MPRKSNEWHLTRSKLTLGIPSKSSGGLEKSNIEKEEYDGVGVLPL